MDARRQRRALWCQHWRTSEEEAQTNNSETPKSPTLALQIHCAKQQSSMVMKVVLTAFAAGFLSGQCDNACRYAGDDYGRFSMKEKACICSHKMDPDDAPIQVRLYLKKRLDVTHAPVEEDTRSVFDYSRE